ncbi:DMT family transporter [uncultured Oscillibacter sp.]|uniref:DMT family transporter n=1 Tax=uncultured Oscillibacter sp. TaxID=876091 RepID=UPI00261F5641|nr:DMT family transporter [uncultured Oscillibacter sp.]
MSERQGAALVIASAILFGLMPLLAKIAYSYGCNVYTVVLGRFSFGALASTLFFLARDGKLPLVSGQQFRKLLLLSVFYTVTPILLYSSYQSVSTGLATTLHFTYPVTVMVLNVVFFHNRLDRRQLLCLALCAGGLALFCRPGEEEGLTGMALAVLSGATYSVYIILLGKSGLRELPVMTTTLWISLFSAGMTGTFVIMSGSLSAPTGWPAWVAMASLGVLATMLALALFQAGVFLCGEVKASLISTFEPLTGIVIGVLIFHEALISPVIFGTGLILSSVVLLVHPRTPVPSEENREIKK